MTTNQQGNRGRFWAGDVLAEWHKPLITRQKLKGTIVLLDGMPSVPSKKELVQFLLNKGWCVVHPRYRGSWESRGLLLKETPDKDVKLVVDVLIRGVKDAYSEKKILFPHNKIILFGASFGGTTAILASRDKRISKAIALSPVADWKVEGKLETIKLMKQKMPIWFGMGYRLAPDGWKKLARGDFFNPATTPRLEGNKILIFHTEGDPIALYKPSLFLAAKIDASFVSIKGNEHLSISAVSGREIWKKINRFL